MIRLANHSFATCRLVMLYMLVILWPCSQGFCQNLRKCEPLLGVTMDASHQLSVDMPKGVVEVVKSTDSNVHITCPSSEDAMQGELRYSFIENSGTYKIRVSSDHLSNTAIRVAIPSNEKLAVHIGVGICRLGNMVGSVNASVTLGEIHIRPESLTETRSGQPASDKQRAGMLRTLVRRDLNGLNLFAHVGVGRIMFQ